MFDSLLRSSLIAMAAAACLGGCIVQSPAYAPAQSYEPSPSYEAPHDYVAPAQYSDNDPPPTYDDSYAEVRVTEAPPPLPEYVQPPCPEPDYLWTPGYWGYGSAGYFWVPGTWVYPPRVGLLWTPGYWGWQQSVYVFHRGYWGPHVGFYGGVNYGGGYIGNGFVGGRWERDRFRYNTSVTNINTTIIHNTYNQTIVNNVTVNRISYNGGRGGVAAAPSRQDQFAARESHVPPPVMQVQHVNEAGRNPALLARYNQGRPAIAATPRAAAFDAPTVVGARGAVPLPPGRGERPFQSGAQAAQGRQDLPAQPPQSRPGFQRPQAPQERAQFQPQQQPQERSQFQAAPQQRSGLQQAPQAQGRPQFQQPQFQQPQSQRPTVQQPRAATPYQPPTQAPQARPQPPQQQRQFQAPAAQAQPRPQPQAQPQARPAAPAAQPPPRAREDNGRRDDRDRR